jgi:hypothetical protein
VDFARERRLAMDDDLVDPLAVSFTYVFDTYLKYVLHEGVLLTRLPNSARNAHHVYITLVYIVCRAAVNVFFIRILDGLI